MKTISIQQRFKTTFEHAKRQSWPQYIHISTSSLPPETALIDVNWYLTGGVGYKLSDHQIYSVSSLLSS